MPPRPKPRRPRAAPTPVAPKRVCSRCGAQVRRLIFTPAAFRGVCRGCASEARKASGTCLKCSHNRFDCCC